MCFSGNDLAEQKKLKMKQQSHLFPNRSLFDWETIQHKKFKKGIVVGKDHGAPSKIIVILRNLA
jgi:hypothetical protein